VIVLQDLVLAALKGGASTLADLRRVVHVPDRRISSTLRALKREGRVEYWEKKWTAVDPRTPWWRLHDEVESEIKTWPIGGVRRYRTLCWLEEAREVGNSEGQDWVRGDGL